MPAHCSEYDLADHYRDTHKHEPRPGDTPAHRFDKPKVGMTALEVAETIQGISVPRAAELIELYAGTVAEAAKLDVTIEMDRRIGVAIEAPLARKEPPYGEWCRHPAGACVALGYCPLDPTCGD